MLPVINYHGKITRKLYFSLLWFLGKDYVGTGCLRYSLVFLSVDFLRPSLRLETGVLIGSKKLI